MKLGPEQCWYGSALVTGGTLDLQTRGTRCVVMAPISSLSEHYNTASTAKDTEEENHQDTVRRTVTLAMQKALDKPLHLPSSAKVVHSLRKGELLYTPPGWVHWEMAQDGDVSALNFRVPTPVVGVKTDLLQVVLQGSYETMLASSVMLLAGKKSLASRLVVLKEHLEESKKNLT